MSKILIVGGGLTGASVRHFLSAAPVAVTLWEAAPCGGGRMRSEFLAHCSGNHRCDLGAQYISQDINGLADDSVYDYLVNKRVFRLADNTLINGMRPEHRTGNHFVSPPGTSNIPAALMVGATGVEFSKELNGLKVSVSNPSQLLAISEKGTSEEAFDAVILTMPAPQVSRILQHESMADIKLVPEELLNKLQKVRYSSRYDDATSLIHNSLVLFHWK